jgi:hypothetical protein
LPHILPRFSQTRSSLFFYWDSNDRSHVRASGSVSIDMSPRPDSRWSRLALTGNALWSAANVERMAIRLAVLSGGLRGNCQFYQ